MAAGKPLPLFPAIRLALTLGALAWIVHWFRSSGAGLRLIPGPASWHLGPMAAALALVPAGLLLRAWKWRTTVAMLEPGATLRESLASYLGAVPLSLITPGRLGEFSRGLYFPHVSLHGWRASGLVAVDKYTDLLAVLAWSIPGMAHFFGLPGAVAIVAALAVLAPLPAWLGSLLPEGVRSADGPIDPLRAAREGRFGRIASRVLARLGRIVPPAALLAPSRMTGLTVLGCAAFGLEWIQLGLLLRVAGCEAPFLPVAGMAALITLCNSLQLTIAGLGVREGLSMAWLVPLGVPAEAAVFAAFSLFCLDVLIPACLGLAMAPHGLRRLRGADAGLGAPGRGAA